MLLGAVETARFPAAVAAAVACCIPVEPAIPGVVGAVGRVWTLEGGTVHVNADGA